MKTKHIWFTIFSIALFLGVVTWCFFYQSPASSHNHSGLIGTNLTTESKPKINNTNGTDQQNYGVNDQYSLYTGLSADELLKNKPPMFKTQTVPPSTPAEKAMWLWREAMEKVDPDYANKTPIEFYGKVVDQNGQPVAGATADLQWTGIQGEALDKATKITGTDGRFVLSGVEGKLLSVWVHKDGCVGKMEVQGDYDFADFSAPNFYLPDSNNPIVFRVWKLGNSEPMFKNHAYGDLTVDGKLFWLDVKNGRFGDVGDVAFSVFRHNLEKGRESGYTLTVQAAPGGGMTVSSGEEFMFQAPAGGYQTAIRIEQAAMRNGSDMGFKVTQNLRFYMRTADGKYMAVSAEVGQSGFPKADVSALIFYNPSGSRNLEFDDKKQINR
jgi:hypothetical protein